MNALHPARLMMATLTRTPVRLFATACVAVTLSCQLSCESGEPLSATADVTVNFSGPTAASPALLLYSGREAANCVSYEPHVGTPSVTLDDVAWDPVCAVEVDVFAASLGAFANTVDPNTPGSEGWLTSAIASGTLDITLPGLKTLPLKIWLVADAADLGTAEDMRDRLLNKAYPILETLGAGITLDTGSSTLAPSLVPKDCNGATTIASNPAIYDGTRVNAYFIRYYAGNFNLSPGYNCWMKTHPEILFISWGNTNVTDPTLVHELGHALGLIHPKFPLGGHTYLVPGFGAYNLMATNTDVTEITVGQLYAMNFSSDSWFNRPGSPLMSAIIKTCQDSWGPGTCPALTLAQPGWPP